MKKTKLFLVIVGSLFLLLQKVFAYGIGYSVYPMAENKKLLSTEFVSVLSSNGGMGFQARFTEQMSPEVSLDGGLGVAGGERRNSRLFFGADYRIFSDYQKQPRFSIKSTYENTRDFDERLNVFGVIPIISKGFSFWGHEGFPYAALPINLVLHSTGQTYTTTYNLSLGISGKFPFKRFDNLRGNIETTINLKDSYSGVVMGISYFLN